MPKSTPEAASLSPEVLAKYEPVIGLEVHVQLLTRTKIFCGCSTRFGDPPNTNVCPVCLGLPGTLPVLNKRAVEMAMRAALALNCTVHDHSRFARKNYFYPDLPKGYQISQYELPLATGGWLEVEVNGAKKRIGITRLHLEEDAAKNLHEGFSQSATKAYIDYNRCGTPLSEIVSEPDMRTPEEAYAYLTTLRQILLYTGVSDCNMEEGSLRCDANVSVRPRGSKEFGTKVEVKNLNSFRFLQKALEFEIERHIAVLESGGRLSQETRLWNQAEGRTVSMRSKEKAHDYRYFPEPDLLPVHISAAWREEVSRNLPKSPSKTREEFIQKYSLSPYDADILTATKKLAEYFDQVLGQPFWVRKDAKLAANWIQNEFLRLANEFGKSVEKNDWPPQAEAAVLLQRIQEKMLTAASAKKVLTYMFERGMGVDEAVRAVGGTTPLLDTGEIEMAAREIIAKEPANVAKYKSGNEGVFKFFVGQVMKATRGQANPQAVNDILRKLLYPTLKEQHEKAVGDSFFDRYNSQQGTSYVFSREGKPPEPDLIYEDKRLGTIGVEITSTYLNEDEGKFVGQLSRGEIKPGAVWTSGTISASVDDFAPQLLSAIQKKLGKTYSFNPIWLVVDFNYLLGEKDEAVEIVGKAAEMTRSAEPMPFAQIWVLWQIPNVEPAQYEVFQVR
jgi:aspartyl-tRNA(Asn)/glutamyl-tRNA(Gln) amidotransferase subunit B